MCMNSFLGFGREHVERHYRKTGQSVYMHLKRHVKEVRRETKLLSSFFIVGFFVNFTEKVNICFILHSKEPVHIECVMETYCAESNNTKKAKETK